MEGSESQNSDLGPYLILLNVEIGIFKNHRMLPDFF